MEQKAAQADAGKFMIESDLLPHDSIRWRAFEKYMQLRDVPGAVVKREEHSTACLAGAEAEGAEKGFTGGENLQIFVEHQQRLAYGFQDDLRQRARVRWRLRGRNEGHIFSNPSTIGLLPGFSESGPLHGKASQRGWDEAIQKVKLKAGHDAPSSLPLRWNSNMNCDPHYRILSL